ncbi:hypothetical protein [Streptomyces sp. NPDC002851]
MDRRVRSAVLWSTVTGAGLLVTLFGMAAAPSAAPPRWDLIAGLAVAGAGFSGWRRTLRGGIRWSDRQGGAHGFAWLAWVLLVFFLTVSIASFSPQAWRISEAGHTMRQVTVEKVLGSEEHSNKGSKSYTNDVRVSVSFRDGSRRVEGQVTTRRWAAVPGDTVWALYAPNSAELGVLLSNDRSSLETKIGGPADPWAVLSLGGLLAACLAFAVMATRSGNNSLGPILHPRSQQSTHARTVTVTGAGVARDERNDQGKRQKQPQPCLFLEAGDGERTGDGENDDDRLEFFLHDAIDLPSLAPQVTGRRGRIFWVHAPRKGTRRGPDGFGSVKAVMTFGDTYCLEGRLQTVGAPDAQEREGRTGRPAGRPVTPASVVNGGRGLREFPVFPAWDLLRRRGTAVVLLMGLSALAAVAYGMGTVWTWLLAGFAALAPGFAWLGTQLAHMERWELLLPDGEHAVELPLPDDGRQTSGA